MMDKEVKELVEWMAVQLWLITGHASYLEWEDDEVRNEYIKKAKHALSYPDLALIDRGGIMGPESVFLLSEALKEI